MSALTQTSPTHPARSRCARGVAAGLRVVCLGALLAVAAGANAQSIGHRIFMQGQVLQIDDSGLVVCIGTRDGAKVGQVLDLIRHVTVSKAPKQAGPGFRREVVGKVRIAEIFDEYYARAQIIEGTPKTTDMVELISD